MTPKFPLTEAPTQDALLRGVEKLSRAVKETFGPSGRTIILDKKFGACLATRNGVIIAEEFELEDPDENAGAQFIREIAGSTSQTAGGGTTTATVLAEFIYKEGLRNVSAGANPISLQRGIHKAVDAVVEELKRISKTVNDHTEIAQMATISAQWDNTIGEIIADAMDKVGHNGSITIIDAKTTRTSLEIVKGTQFDTGYLSPYFTNSATMEVVLEDPYIFMHGNKTLSLKDLLPLLEKIAQAGASLLIIADDIENEALTGLIVNKIRGTLQVCAVKAPAFGDRRKAMLKDIAILTGAQYDPDDPDSKIEKVKIEHLGRAKRIVVDKENTMIVGGSGREAEIQKRAASIRTEIGEAADDYDRCKLEQRLAKLTGGIGLISVGAATETERNEKKARVENALRATRAAAEEGVVLGGGVAFIRAQKALDQFKDLGGDEKVGVAIVHRALEEPSRQIANNAGHEGALIVQELKLQHGNVGYNVASGEYVDFFAAGIVDATKVTRSALQNAASISNLLLASETTIAREAPSPEFEIGSAHTTRMSNDGGSGDGPPSPPIPPTFKSTDPAGPPPRYLVAKAEKSVKLGVPFILNSGIRTEAIPAAEGQGSSAVQGDVTGKLTIEIHAPDFISKDGTQREIEVPDTGNSSWAAFELVASEKGVHTIDVLVFKNSAVLGAVTISVGVEVESPGKNDVQNEMDVRDPETGEYTLKIVYEKKLKKYRFDLSSDTENLEPVYSDEPDEPDESPQDIYTDILTNLNIQARNLNHLSTDAQREWLESMGSILYKQFIPAKLKEALWQNRNKIRYLNILSKADPMPWELLYVRDEAGSSEGEFISNTATVTRWRWGTLAGRKLSRKNPYFVLPKGSLPEVEEEVQYLRDKVGAGEDHVVRELDGLLKLLKSAQFSLLHFASHNITDPSVAGRLYIPFGSAKFDITFMGKWTNTQFSAQRPLVFMNSCTSGGTVPLYKEMAGWADHFLGAGCGAFVGSLWEIRNESARKFAEKFYDEVTAGRNLGESMRAARKELGTSDPTHLAYTLYGHPLAKLL